MLMMIQEMALVVTVDGQNHMKNMTGCDSLPGSVKWYHLLCAGIDRKKAPEGK